MIGRLLLCPRAAIDLCICQPVGGLRAQEEMIDPQARIARPAACLVIPEGVELVIERMNLAERVDPALIDQPSEGGTAVGLAEGIKIGRASGGERGGQYGEIS